MSTLFLTVLNRSIKAGWLILAVLLARVLLKRAPKWIFCLLWGLVAVCLLFPFSFESVFSLIPSSETVPMDIALQAHPAIDSGIAFIDEAANPVIAGSFTPQPYNSVNPLQVIIPIVSIVWLIGAGIMMGYALISYLRLKKSVSASISLEEGVLVSDEVKTPFILGIFRPVIYVPSSMNEETLKQVLAHERAHLARHDHWWKPLGFLLLSICWFHPLFWIAYIFLCRDIEMACDERVIRDMDREAVAAYSEALLDCSRPGRMISACPLAFGEAGVKERIQDILNYKRPAFWIIVLSLVLCAVLAVCLLSDPKKDFTIERSDIEKVAYYNAFLGDDCQGELDSTQIDEMVKRFALVSGASSSSRYAGLTPGYQLCIFLKDGSKVFANGYDAVSHKVEIIYEGKRYAVNDPAFAIYLRSVCSKQNSGGVRTSVIYVNWSEDNSLYECLNADKLIMSSYRHLPVYKIETAEELRGFIDKYKGVLSFDFGKGDAPSFYEAISKYDDSFFADHTLVMAYITAGSGSYRFEIRDVAVEGEEICLNVIQTNHPETVTDDMAGWLAIAEIPKEDLTGISSYDAKFIPEE